MNMFALFSRETAIAPCGLLRLDSDNTEGFSEDEYRCYSECQNDSKERTRRSAEIKRQCSRTLEEVHGKCGGSKFIDLGGGNGFNYVASPFCHYASSNGSFCLFSGEIAARPDLDLVSENHNAYVTGKDLEAIDEASWLLSFYGTFQRILASNGATDEALRSLAKIDGPFSFVLYDGNNHRVLAARDRDGTQQLYWGSTPDGRLMFGANPEDLAECHPSATAFPAGCLFMSETKAKAMMPGELGWMIEPQVVPGEVKSFIPHTASHQAQKFRGTKAVPRVNSKGCLCGAVYRVASEGNFTDWAASH